jgi:hypothetical protein
MPLPNRYMSDWEWVKKQIAADAPVPYDAIDPDDGTYDPNNDAALEAYFKEATILVGWPNPVMIQKDGVPTPRSEQFPAKTHSPAPRLRNPAQYPPHRFTSESIRAVSI